MMDYSLSNSRFGDKRLFSRFVVILNQLLHAVGQSLPSCGVLWSQTKAIYRFFDNSAVDASKILALELGRVEACIAKSSSRCFYHIQDTTTLNYSDKKGRYDLNCLNYIHHRGFFLHTSLVLDADYVVMGLLAQDFYGRDEAELGKSRQKDTRSTAFPIEVKESYRWLRHFEAFQMAMLAKSDAQGISICDAEGDFYELFAAKRCAHVDLVVRLQHNHTIDAGADKVLARLGRQTSAGFAFTQVTTADKHTQRAAQLEIRFIKISLPLPDALKWSAITPQQAKKRRQEAQQTGGLTLWAVQAKEIDTPPQTKPIEWTLLTTMPVTDYWEALNIIQIYALRWQIEIFHLALKEGCAIENLQLQTQHRLKNAITIYSIVAVYVLKMRYLAQYCPNQPIEMTGFSKQNYQTISVFLQVNHRMKINPQQNPTVEDFVKLIIILAGGNPKQIGIRQLWKGMTKADTILKTAEIFKKQ